MTARIAWILAVATICAMAAERGHACVCTDGRGLPIAFPDDGATGVPVDAALWWFSDISGAEPTTRLRVIDDTGVVVDGAWRALGWESEHDARPFLFVPRSSLAAERSYAVEEYQYDPDELRAGGLTDEEIREHFVIARVRFTTGSFATRVALPSTPVVSNVALAVGTGSSDCDGLFFDERVELTMNVEHDALLYVVDIDGAASAFGARDIAGRPSAFGAAPDVLFGTTSCAQPWPSLQSGTASTFRFRATDARGRVSAWSEPVLVDVPLLHARGWGRDNDPPPAVDEGEPDVAAAAACGAAGGSTSLTLLVALTACALRRRSARQA